MMTPCGISTGCPATVSFGTFMGQIKELHTIWPAEQADIVHCVDRVLVSSQRIPRDTIVIAVVLITVAVLLVSPSPPVELRIGHDEHGEIAALAY